MAADDLIKLEFSFVSGGADRVAGLFWVNENGDEQKYADVHERGMLTQETFAGHRWVLKGARTNDVLLEVVAAAEPPVQSFRIDIDGEEAELVRPGRRRGERAPAGGEGAGDEPRGDEAMMPPLQAPPLHCQKRPGAGLVRAGCTCSSASRREVRLRACAGVSSMSTATRSRC